MTKTKVGESSSRTKHGGRTKGTPNKLTADVKSMILGALNAVGGEKYLVKQANENPKAFLGLVGKVLPLQVTGADGDPLTVQIVRHGADPASK